MNGNKLYVGNINYSVGSEQLRELFSQYGEVGDVRIIEGKGFGFVEMATKEEAEKAKQALNGTEFAGRSLRIDDARPKKEKPGGRGRHRY